jgi:hypothetical protein
MRRPASPGRRGREEGSLAALDWQMARCRRHLLLLAMLAASRPAEASRPRVGEVSSVAGTAVARFPGPRDEPRSLAPASPVLLKDILETEASARLACLLEGRLELRLGGGAHLCVDTAVLQGPRTGLVLRDFGTGGPLLVDRAPTTAALPIVLELPWARIGVRGTRVFAGVMDGSGAVFVARGRVTVDAIGTRVTLAEGEGVDIPLQPFGPPDLPVRRWGQARIARALASVE